MCIHAALYAGYIDIYSKRENISLSQGQSPSPATPFSGGAAQRPEKLCETDAAHLLGRRSWLDVQAMIADKPPLSACTSNTPPFQRAVFCFDNLAGRSRHCSEVAFWHGGVRLNDPASFPDHPILNKDLPIQTTSRILDR